ncbi:MAG TPA: hypothetical protein VK727_09550 [Steroidobacteraceae bacterium]|nr:hypothetical protein [Steroidobacteraceae bacterium]
MSKLSVEKVMGNGVGLFPLMAKNPSMLTLDAQAAAYVNAQVSEDRAKLADVIKRQEALAAERRALEWKIAKLSGEDIPPNAIERPLARTPAEILAGSPSTGFRDVLRKVVRESDNGLKPKQAAELIRASGFNYTASTDLSVRVSNELRQLARNGTVVRKRGLYYFNRDFDVASNGQGESP